MGFSDGTAAFEARQQAAREKAAAAAGAAPPVGGFDGVMASARRSVQEKIDDDAQAAEGWRRTAATAIERMTELSSEFSHRADAMGYQPLTIVIAGSVERIREASGHSKTIHRFQELIGEGWEVSDPDNVDDWGVSRTRFVVMREGPWINLCSGGTGMCSGEVDGLPRNVDPGRVRGFMYLQHVNSTYLPRNAEEILAKTLVRAERGDD
ncbi:hypothetical protein [Arthrobacter sp. SPG23]|uniref:hypothetical protein n=1 Tax=Arthrobacter sp. SPG23 TaxID=1610703 RepID=UPI0011863CCB|nr:hypothetical protein [Arthrobacter sp. SPG23]